MSPVEYCSNFSLSPELVGVTLEKLAGVKCAGVSNWKCGERSSFSFLSPSDRTMSKRYSLSLSLSSSTVLESLLLPSSTEEVDSEMSSEDEDAVANDALLLELIGIADA